MLLYFYRDKVPYSRALFLVCLGALVLCSFLPGGIILVLPVCGSYALLYLASSRLGMQRFARRGDFSYGLYLYAFPI